MILDCSPRSLDISHETIWKPATSAMISVQGSESLPEGMLHQRKIPDISPQGSSHGKEMHKKEVSWSGLVQSTSAGQHMIINEFFHNLYKVGRNGNFVFKWFDNSGAWHDVTDYYWFRSPVPNQSRHLLVSLRLLDPYIVILYWL